MNTTPRSTIRRLRRDHFLHFKARQRLCLRAERGTLWVTVDGEPDDIELDPGQAHVFDNGANIVIGTLGGDAVFSATLLATAGGWWQRLRARLGAAPLLGAA